MLFATTALTPTVAVICIVTRSVFSNTVMTSPDDGIDTQPGVYYCNNSLQCPSIYGFDRCENHKCICDENFYQTYNNTSGKTYCHLCSLFQESCAVTKCCQNHHATLCLNDMCVCRPGMNDECLGRYTPTLGIQLANTLSVSFAFVFLAITFVAVIRKTLFSCSFCRCDSMSRVASNSSLNEFVKQKMQNRPPSYDDIEKDRKVPIDTNLPPPEYGAMHFGRVGAFRSGSYLNPTYSISNEVELNTAPPNYSTFTSVTAVATDQTGADREIILTRPIYTNHQ